MIPNKLNSLDIQRFRRFIFAEPTLAHLNLHLSFAYDGLVEIDGKDNWRGVEIKGFDNGGWRSESCLKSKGFDIEISVVEYDGITIIFI